MAASGISFAIPSDMAREFMKNAKERVKTLKSSSGLAPSKFKAQERFYIGKFTLRLRFIRNELHHDLGPTYNLNLLPIKVNSKHSDAISKPLTEVTLQNC